MIIQLLCEWNQRKGGRKGVGEDVAMDGRATHPSVSWKLTFTFLADPRSSETQIKWNIN